MVYAAEQRVPSAVVAITFAALSLCTQILFRLLVGRRASPLAWLGSALGVAGVACLFAEQIARAPIAAHAALGLVFAVIGMLAAAIGNYFAWRQERAGGAIASTTAWSMAYAGDAETPDIPLTLSDLLRPTTQAQEAMLAALRDWALRDCAGPPATGTAPPPRR